MCLDLSLDWGLDTPNDGLMMGQNSSSKYGGLLMADLNQDTQIPLTVNTVERYVAHAILLMNSLYAALTYQELPGALLERVCDVNIVTAADGTIRLIGRVSIPLDPAYVTGSAKLWAYAQEINEVANIPVAYTVD